jgi:hypothetical protein
MTFALILIPLVLLGLTAIAACLFVPPDDYA